jgi:hydrogenase maturation protease
MLLKPTTSLIIGIGNQGRKDDGIGWALVDRIQECGYQGRCEFRYQLNVEDAELVAQYETVLFIDATHESLPDGYALREVEPISSFTFSTHELSPAAVLHLAEDLYDQKPTGHLLVIQGYEWGIGEGLSDQAAAHLEQLMKSLCVPLCLASEEDPSE